MNDPLCPFCHKLDCQHFIGWTEDGRQINMRNEKAAQMIKEGDKCVNTGVSTRVYRKGKK